MENKAISSMSEDELLRYQDTLEAQDREVLNKLTTAELEKIQLQRDISRLVDNKRDVEARITKSGGDHKIITSLLRECKNRYWNSKNARS